MKLIKNILGFLLISPLAAIALSVFTYLPVIGIISFCKWLAYCYMFVIILGLALAGFSLLD